MFLYTCRGLSAVCRLLFLQLCSHDNVVMINLKKTVSINTIRLLDTLNPI